ncbi:hypothetical protein C8R47DRAFT_337754 [Mycena vitilis]|nr:hypothetical protein C8R47DRAFT_337754 [Mycena vitilis]
MANILARFGRGRTKSMSGASALTPPGPTLPTAPAAPATQPGGAGVQSAPLERKIHPDLDSLVANWTPPPVQPSPSGGEPASSSAPEQPSSAPLFSTALRPSTRRHSIDGVVPVLRPRHTDTQLDGLPELPVPVPFAAQAQQPTRTQRLITRLTGASTPPSSMPDLATTSATAGWSTFGRGAKKTRGDTGRPHLTDFGEFGRGSPAPSRGTSVSRSVSQSRSHSQVNLGTPSTMSQQLDESATYSNSGHEHPMTPASDLASPSSGFTFGSRDRVSGRPSTAASVSPPPPMPPLDHPAFRGSSQSAYQSQSPSQVQLPQLFAAGHARSSSSLPSMPSSSRRKRFRGGIGDRTKAQDIFASLRRPGSARRRASAEFSSSRGTQDREVVFLALSAGGGREEKPDSANLKDTFGPGGDSRGGNGDFKFDARPKRVVCPSVSVIPILSFSPTTFAWSRSLSLRFL